MISHTRGDLKVVVSASRDKPLGERELTPAQEQAALKAARRALNGECERVEMYRRGKGLGIRELDNAEENTYT